MKSELSGQNKCEKFVNTHVNIRQHFLTERWLNNNNKTPREIVTYFEIDENEYATCQNVRDAATSVLTGKRVDVNAYVKKKKI